jgi:hypothetical protein
MSRILVSAATLLGAAWLCLFPVSAAQAAILITIDKATQKMNVEVDGATRWIWPVSTGRRGYDTPAGSFRPFRLEEDHYSKEWDEAPMPYSIFFTTEGHAIHGSYETRNLGRPASHGCVRLSPSNAEKLFRLVEREGVSKARVVVLGESSAPAVSRNRAPAQEASRRQEPRRAESNPFVATAPARASAQAPNYMPNQDYGFAPREAYGYAAPQSPPPRLAVPRSRYQLPSNGAAEPVPPPMASGLY